MEITQSVRHNFSEFCSKYCTGIMYHHTSIVQYVLINDGRIIKVANRNKHNPNSKSHLNFYCNISNTHRSIRQINDTTAKPMNIRTLWCKHAFGRFTHGWSRMFSSDKSVIFCLSGFPCVMYGILLNSSMCLTYNMSCIYSVINCHLPCTDFTCVNKDT